MPYEGYGYGPPPPGMMPPGAAPGMPQQAGPSLFGATLGGMGFGGAPYGMEHSAMALQQQQASMMAGAAPINFGMNQALPAVGGALSLAGMTVAPMMAQGGGSMLTRGIGHGLKLFDPFTYATPFAKGGYAMGTRMLGIGGRGFGAAMSTAFRTGGMRAAAGMGMRFGAAGMMGAGAAVPVLGAAMLAGEGVMEAGRQVWQGAQNNMYGQQLMNQLGPQIAPGASQQQLMGAGGDVGRMMRGEARDMGVGMEDVGRLAQGMNQMKLFQTTSSVKEFKSRFKEVLDAVKDIAKTTQSTLDDALKTFGDLRQEGFYTTADIKAAAAKREAREMSTGISAETFQAVGQMGAQAARSRGMKGRVGSEAFQRSVAGVSRGLRAGTMDEETIMEMGGVEAAGMRLADQQMGFLGSARGRAMIAATMGQGGAPDIERMSQVMGGGMSMESLVTGAAGRGLGVLRQAGTAEAREKYMPYAGMMMVQMAAAQQKQLHGGVTRRGVIGMLGTMGVGRDEASLMMQQAAELPGQMSAEANAQQLQEARAREADIRGEGGMMGSIKGALRRNVGMPLQDIGSREYTRFQRIYRGMQRSVTGYQEFEGGDRDMARDYANQMRDRGESFELPTEPGSDGGLFGPPSGTARLRDSIPPSMTMPEDIVRRQIEEGSVDEKDIVFLGGGKAIRRSELERFTSANDTRSVKLSDEQRAKLKTAVLRGDLKKKYDKARSGIEARGAIGTGSASEQEFSTFFLMKEAGMLSDDTSFLEYTSGRAGFNQQERIRMQNTLGEFMQGQEDERLRSILKPNERDLGPIASIESERARSEEGMKDFFRSATPGFMGFGISGAGKGLMERLQESGKARSSMSDVMAALEDGDPQKIADALENAKETMGEEGFQAVQNIARQVMDDPNGKGKDILQGWKQKGGLKDVLGRRAFAEAQAEKMGRTGQALEKNIGKLDDMSSFSQDMKRNLRTMKRAASGGNVADFRRAQTDVFKEAITSGGDFTAEEETLLNEMLGGSAGSKIGDLVRQLTGEDAEKRKSVLEGMGVKGEQLEKLSQRLSSKDTADRQQAVVEALMQGMGDQIDPGLIKGKGESEGTTVAGVQTKYVEANAQFVTAVHRFLSSTADILGDEELKSAASGLRMEGGD